MVVIFSLRKNRYFHIKYLNSKKNEFYSCLTSTIQSPFPGRTCQPLLLPCTPTKSTFRALRNQNKWTLCLMGVLNRPAYFSPPESLSNQIGRVIPWSPRHLGRTERHGQWSPSRSSLAPRGYDGGRVICAAESKINQFVITLSMDLHESLQSKIILL